MPLPWKPSHLPVLPSKAEGSVTQCGRTHIVIFVCPVFSWEVEPHSQPENFAFSLHPFTALYKILSLDCRPDREVVVTVTVASGATVGVITVEYNHF